MADSPAAPCITVVISTRDRGDSVIMPMRGILRNEYTNFELIVVDQSDDDLTATAVQPCLVDHRVRYMRSATRGVAAGQNAGISQARSEWIAVTDDDCEVPQNWLSEFVEAFASDKNIGLVYGNVLGAAHDASAGFVVSYVRTEPILIRSMREKHLVQGAGACMGLRRSMWRDLGGFDETLGVGAPLQSSFETDFTIRALLAGHAVFETPKIAVTHCSFMSWDQGKTIIGLYLYGNGATLAKHLKCGHWSVVRYYLVLGLCSLFGRPPVAVHMGPHAHKALKIMSFAQGFVAGALTPVDRSKGHFAPTRRQPSGQ